MRSVRFSVFPKWEDTFMARRRRLLCDNPACRGDERDFHRVSPEHVEMPEELLQRRKTPTDITCTCHRCGYVWFQGSGYDPGYGTKTPVGFYNDMEDNFIVTNEFFPFDPNR